MTIDEAIENCKNMLTFIGPEDLPESRISLKLAIEALTYLKAIRYAYPDWNYKTLPGETKE